MTDEQNKLFGDLEARIKQIIILCDRLKVENQKLKNNLLSTNKEMSDLKKELGDLKKNYDNLKIARTITAASVDVETAKNKLSFLVQKVDKCIKLLNK